MYLVRPPYLLKKLYPKAIWRMDSTKQKLYLTFDDGPIPEITSWVLDVLKQNKIKATFFCVGENVVKHPEIFQRIINEGHRVGNHTYNHLKGWNTHTKDYLNNVELCNQVLLKSNQAETSVYSEPIETERVELKYLFRPPYGRAKKSQISNLKSQYDIIMWDVLSGDYDKNTSPEKCLKNVTDTIRSGSIIVFHDSYKAQKNLQYALPHFIDFAQSKGFEFGLL